MFSNEGSQIKKRRNCTCCCISPHVIHATLEAFSQLNSSHSIIYKKKETILEAVVVDWYLDWQWVVPTGNQKIKSKVLMLLCYRLVRQQSKEVCSVWMFSMRSPGEIRMQQ